MKLIFVRHGPKERSETLDDADLPLSADATLKLQRLASALSDRGFSPRVIVTSCYRHALDTAEALRGARTRHVIPVTALTPHTPETAFTMSTIISEAMAAGVDVLRDCETLMLVGHETRLSQLAARVMEASETLEELSVFEVLVVDWHGVLQERFKT